MTEGKATLENLSAHPRISTPQLQPAEDLQYSQFKTTAYGICHRPRVSTTTTIRQTKTSTIGLQDSATSLPPAPSPSPRRASGCATPFHAPPSLSCDVLLNYVIRSERTHPVLATPEHLWGQDWMVPEPTEEGGVGREGQPVAEGGSSAIDEPNWNARNDH